jgi:hypothetical protein
MSLVTVSTKKNRVYERAFDHDEALAMRAAGESYAAIARHFGVSPTSIARVCNPKTRQRMDEAARRNAQAKRRPCKGGCGRLVWLHVKDRSGYCATCVAALSTVADERPGELRCTKCEQWKADGEFRQTGRRTRRGRNSQCRSCETAVRNDYRQRNASATALYDLNRKGLATVNTYLVLRQETGENGASARWVDIGEIEAPSPAAAIEKLGADGPGIYIAANPSSIIELSQTVVWRAVSRRSRPTGSPSMTDG